MDYLLPLFPQLLLTDHPVGCLLSPPQPKAPLQASGTATGRENATQCLKQLDTSMKGAAFGRVHHGPLTFFTRSKSLET